MQSKGLSRVFSNIIGVMLWPCTPLTQPPKPGKAQWSGAGVPSKANAHIEKSCRQKQLLTSPQSQPQPQNPAWPCPWCSSVGQSTSALSVCETDEAAVITLCCKTETVEAQRGQTSCLRLHSGSVPCPGLCLGLSGPRAACFPLLSSGLKWICSWCSYGIRGTRELLLSAS